MVLLVPDIENKEVQMWLLKEVWELLKKRKRLWMFPLLLLLIGIGFLLMAAQGSVLAPFIYTIF